MLGDINPQTIKIDQQAVVYPGRDHVTVLTIKRYDGRSYRPVDTSLLTRVVLVFPDTSPVIAYDSDILPAVFSWTGSTITIDLSDYAMPASSLPCWLIAYDAQHVSGQVLVDNNDTTLEFDFRNVNTTGVVPAPTVDFVTEAPIDGMFYGRKDGQWSLLGEVVAGVSSVNGETGDVTLDAADVGAEPAGLTASNIGGGIGLFKQKVLTTLEFKSLVAGTNITLTPVGDTVVFDVPETGAVDSVNGQTGVVVLDAADVGAEVAGAVAAHVALSDPHPQYGLDTDVVNARFQSTGLISGGALSINGGDNTKFDVAAGVAVFADYTNPSNSVATTLAFGPLTAVAVPNIATANVSYVGINSAGAIVQQTTRFTNTQRRSICSLGAVVHSNHANLNAINTIVAVNRQLLNQFGDGMRAIGQLNLSGNVYAPVGANLQLQKSAGELFSPGANFHVNPDDPHAAVLGAVSPVTFRYRQANGAEGTDTTNVNPALYDNAGVLTAVPANRYTVQLIAIFQSGITRLQYGQVIYNTLADAVAAATSQAMTLEQNIAENGIVRGFIAVKGDATALNNTAQAVFITLSKFNAAASVAPITLSTTDELAEGTTNLYFTVARVRNTILTGLSTAVNMAITAADTVLDAFGKLQAQINGHFGVGGSTHPNAVASGAAGFISGANQAKLDGIATGANLYVHPNHSGDVTSVGDGAQTIVNDAVTNAKLANMITQTIKGRSSGSTGDPEDLTAAQVRTILNVADGATPLPVVQALSSTRNLALADNNTFNVNSTTNNYTVTILPQSSVAWLADTEVHFLPSNTGDITITGGTGVSVNGVVAGSLTLSTQYGAASIKRIAADSWWVGGALGQIGASGDWATSGGSANTYTLTPVVARSSYVTGDQFRTRFSVTNTGATTVNVSGLGAKTCVTVTGAALPAGYIRTDADTVLSYDGTNFVTEREVEYGSNANGTFWRYADGKLDMNAEVSFNTSVTDASTNFTYPATPIASPQSGGITGPVSLNTTVAADVKKITMHLQVANWRLFLAGTGTSGAQAFKLNAMARWYT